MAYVFRFAFIHPTTPSACDLLVGNTRWTFHWHSYKATHWLDTNLTRWARDDRCFGALVLSHSFILVWRAIHVFI